MPETSKGEKIVMNGKGLNQLPSPVKVFIISYMVLMAAGLLLSLWIVVKSPVWSGSGAADPIKQMEEAGMGKEAIEGAKSARFYSYLKLAHIHHLGHMFIVFSVAGLYAFTSAKDKLKIQIIIWATIVTLVNSLAFLIYSRILLIVFGSAYGALMAYMIIMVVIECLKPVGNSVIDSQRSAETI